MANPKLKTVERKTTVPRERFRKAFAEAFGKATKPIALPIKGGKDETEKNNTPQVKKLK